MAATAPRFVTCLSSARGRGKSPAFRAAAERLGRLAEKRTSVLPGSRGPQPMGRTGALMDAEQAAEALPKSSFCSSPLPRLRFSARAALNPAMAKHVYWAEV